MSNQTRDYLATEILKMEITDVSEPFAHWGTFVEGKQLMLSENKLWIRETENRAMEEFDPLTNLNHLAMVLGKLPKEAHDALHDKIKAFQLDFHCRSDWIDVDALLLFANEPATLCELIVEADKEGK